MQNAAFLVQFREELTGDGPFGGPWGDGRIDELEPASLDSTGAESLDEIFDLIGRDDITASRKTLAYMQTEGYSKRAFMSAARRMSMIKCKNGHDYKFSSAVLEDYHRISPAWRDRYLAASVHYLRGTNDAENRLVQPTRDLLKA